jgi:hypothetical protein
MEIIIETNKFLPCTCKTFKIDNIDCDWSIFVETYDRSPEYAKPYTCENRCARPNKISEIKKSIKQYYPELKYLTIEDIEEIQDRLCDALHVGKCGYCY